MNREERLESGRSDRFEGRQGQDDSASRAQNYARGTGGEPGASGQAYGGPTGGYGGAQGGYSSSGWYGGAGGYPGQGYGSAGFGSQGTGGQGYGGYGSQGYGSGSAGYGGQHYSQYQGTFGHQGQPGGYSGHPGAGAQGGGNFAWGGTGPSTFSPSGYGHPNYTQGQFGQQGYGGQHYGQQGQWPQSYGQGNRGYSGGQQYGQGYGAQGAMGTGSPGYGTHASQRNAQQSGPAGYGEQGYGAQGWGQNYPPSSPQGYGAASYGSEAHGGWAGQGPHVGRQTTRGPKGYSRTDERLREEVCERIVQNPDIDATDVEIEVKDGVVSLSGTVQSRQEKHRLEDIADSVWGIKDLHNNIRVKGGGFFSTLFGDATREHRDIERRSPIPGEGSSSGTRKVPKSETDVSGGTDIRK